MKFVFIGFIVKTVWTITIKTLTWCHKKSSGQTIVNPNSVSHWKEQREWIGCRACTEAICLPNVCQFSLLFTKCFIEKATYCKQIYTNETKMFLWNSYWLMQIFVCIGIYMYIEKVFGFFFKHFVKPSTYFLLNISWNWLEVYFETKQFPYLSIYVQILIYKIDSDFCVLLWRMFVFIEIYVL